jgi:hypothetical protein
MLAIAIDTLVDTLISDSLIICFLTSSVKPISSKDAATLVNLH